MEVFEEYAKVLRSDGERVAKEIACLKEELSGGTKLKAEEQLRLQRLLERKLRYFEQNEEALKTNENVKACLDVHGKRGQRRKQEKIISSFAFYCRSFHSQIARMMKMRWRDLACNLRKEHNPGDMRDGDRWEKPYHREVFVHLQELGFSKEEWRYTLQFFTGEELDFTDNLLCTPSLVSEKLHRDRKLLNDEDARKILSPVDKEVFAKVLKEFEAQLCAAGWSLLIFLARTDGGQVQGLYKTLMTIITLLKL